MTPFSMKKQQDACPAVFIYVISGTPVSTPKRSG